MDSPWDIPTLDIAQATYTVRELLEWADADRLVVSPDFQRGEVWKTSAKAFLIDTILRGFPVPPIHIRLAARDGNLMREVIDGQQRLTAILQYLSGKFPLARSRSDEVPPWSGKRFAQLPEPLKERILNFSLRCEVYKGQIDDSLVREIFSRINIHSVPLSDQELRNGRYFGEFKQAVYVLSRDYATFWEKSRIFTSQALARMLDAQFVSEVLAVQIGGIPDQKGVIDTLYARYDAEWPDRSTHEFRFRDVIEAVRANFGQLIPLTQFRRPTLFYTLLCVVYHRMYGIEEWRTPPGYPESPRSPRVELSVQAIDRLRISIEDISQYMETVPASSSRRSDAGSIGEFADAASRHTDNIRPRTVRFLALWNLADLSRI